MLRSLFIHFLFISLLVTGCRQSGEEFGEFIEFKNSEVILGEQYVILPFERILDDSTMYVCDYDFVIRYSENCNVREISFRIEYESPAEEKILSESFIIPLFDPKESYSDKHTFGIYQKQIPLFQNLKSDKYSQFTIISDQRAVTGVMSIGIIARRVNL